MAYKKLLLLLNNGNSKKWITLFIYLANELDFGASYKHLDGSDNYWFPFMFMSITIKENEKENEILVAVFCILTKVSGNKRMNQSTFGKLKSI